MIDDGFLDSFKQLTEALWRERPIMGFGPWRGARWLPGLDASQIAEFEREVGAQFPDDYRRLLARMNGTAHPEQREGEALVGVGRSLVDVYSYPRDLARVREVIGWLEWDTTRAEVQSVLADQGYLLEDDAVLVPVYGHRYVVCGADPSRSTVLSVVGSDAIVYGANLRQYLETEFLPPDLRGS